MTPSLLTGLFTLGGVLIGVLLEPVKAMFAARTRRRQECADRCAQLIEAAAASRTLLMEINWLHRSGVLDSGALDERSAETIAEYRAARRTIAQVAILLQMSGPDDLANAASAVRNADRSLRATRLTVEANQEVEVRDAIPEAVREASAELEAEILRFAGVARRHVR
jgi:hypothetical protein